MAIYLDNVKLGSVGVCDPRFAAELLSLVGQTGRSQTGYEQ